MLEIRLYRPFHLNRNQRILPAQTASSCFREGFDLRKLWDVRVEELEMSRLGELSVDCEIRLNPCVR
jgi:hypothetical protein